MKPLDFPNRGKFDPNDWSRFLSDLKKAMVEYPVDTGWIARPASNSISHTLGQVPGFVQIMESNDSRGASYNQLLASSVTTSAIVFSTGAKTYVRVIAGF